MADPDRDIEQALIALKKGTQLIKYSRKRKPKFCPFRLSQDETTLIWYSHGNARNLKLASVQRIIPGQRTVVFKRYLRPEKEYLSFSLIYNNGDRSLDLICKDKVEAELWFSCLKDLISPGQSRLRRIRSESSHPQDFGNDCTHSNIFGATLEFTSSISRGRVSVDTISRDSLSPIPVHVSVDPNSSNSLPHIPAHVSVDSISSNSPPSFSDLPVSNVGFDRGNMHIKTNAGEGFRLSVSSTPSCSSQGSGTGSGADDIESLGDVYIWGEVWSDGISVDAFGNQKPDKSDVLIPKPLESNVVLDGYQVSGGLRHVALVTRQGEIFTWGEESGGRLGHGVEKDFSRPHLVESLAVTGIEFVACGEHHTCAVTQNGDLFTWGDGAHNAGLLGHGNDVSHWIPKRIAGNLDGVQVLSVACGTWHSALTSSTGKLFTFGDGTFGVLGHGDRESVSHPKKVESLDGLKAIKVACGLWHTAAIVEAANQPGSSVSPRKLFSWGDGDKNRLGHGSKDTYLVPTCVSSLLDYNFHQLGCGHNMTVALTTSGHIFTMGSNANGQLGNPDVNGRLPCLVQDRLVGEYVEEIACGSSHVAALTSRSEVFTWGKGANGRLGHGDTDNRDIPTLVEGLKDKHVKNISCGSNFTSCICIHKWVSDNKDQATCTACRQLFGFTRKRHNCYNCGLVHCGNCSSKKAMRASLAPTPGKPHRVCDSCYVKLKNAAVSRPYSMKASGYQQAGSRLERVATRTSRTLLSPTVEPIKYLEVKSVKSTVQPDDAIVRASQVPSLLQLKDISFPSSLSALQNVLRSSTSSSVITPPEPQPSSSSSRPTSPFARRPSPPRSVTPIFSRGVIDTLKKTNEQLTQQVSSLKTQMSKLKKKCQVQTAELQKVQSDAAKAVSLSMERSSHCSSTFQAMKSITSQLKEMTEKLYRENPENETMKSFQSQVDTILNTIENKTHSFESSSILEGAPPSFNPRRGTDEDEIELQDAPKHRERRPSSCHLHEVDPPKHRERRTSSCHLREDELEDKSKHRERRPSSCNLREDELQDTPKHREKRLSPHPPNREDSVSESTRVGRREGPKEVIEQFEPGVYVTLRQLTNGTKIFKRVRFSKRRYSNQQAAEWWSKNKERLSKKYENPTLTKKSVQSTNNTLGESSTSTVSATDEHSDAAQ